MGWRVGASRLPSFIGLTSAGYDCRLMTLRHNKTHRPHCRLCVCARACSTNPLSVEGVQRFLETVGVAALGFAQGFKPVGNFVKTLVASSFGHAGIHIGIDRK